MVTSWLTSDSTLAIYVAAVEAANPSGQIRDLPELQPLILTAQKYLQPSTKHQPGSEVLANKLLAVSLSRSTNCRKEPRITLGRWRR